MRSNETPHAECFLLTCYLSSERGNGVKRATAILAGAPSISITWVLVTPGLHPRPTEPESLGICVLTNFPGDFYALRFEKHDSIITDKPEVIRSILSVRVKHLGRGKSVELLLAECLRQIPASPEAVTRLMRAPHPMPQRTLQHIKQRESGRECYSHRHICNRAF